ncbi:MAG: DUF4241 domain-containing protein [Kofleriaceae bacterium]|nr:DUF4241 domain-containing protein [Kofleriaceae bacterium]
MRGDEEAAPAGRRRRSACVRRQGDHEGRREAQAEGRREAEAEAEVEVEVGVPTRDRREAEARREHQGDRQGAAAPDRPRRDHRGARAPSGRRDHRAAADARAPGAGPPAPDRAVVPPRPPAPALTELDADLDVGRLCRYGERFGPHRLEIQMMPTPLAVTSGRIALADLAAPRRGLVFARTVPAGRYRCTLSLAHTDGSADPPRVAAAVLHVGRGPVVRWVIAHADGKRPPRAVDDAPTCALSSGRRRSSTLPRPPALTTTAPRPPRAATTARRRPARAPAPRPPPTPCRSRAASPARTAATGASTATATPRAWSSTSRSSPRRTGRPAPPEAGGGAVTRCGAFSLAAAPLGRSAS